MTALAVPARVRTSLVPVVTVLFVLTVWVVAAALLAGRHIMPYPWTVLGQMWRDGPVLLQNSGVTLAIAGQGLVAGLIVITPLAVVSVLAPFLAPVVMRVAVVVHTVPFIAIAPILIIVLPGNSSRVTISALLVYFPLLVAVLLGLQSADRRSLEVVTASGGTPWTRLVKVRVPSALPALLAGLQIAVPASLIGALVAEFFGAVDGLGAFLIQAQTQLDAARTWSVALYVGALSTLAYGLVALLGRLVAPWAGKDTSVGGAVAGATGDRLRPWQALVASVLSATLLLGAWQSLISVLHLDSFFTKGPVDVWLFLTRGRPESSLGDIGAGGSAADFWSAFLPALGQTAVDSAVGFAVGMVGAVLLAGAMVAVRPLETGIMPFAIALRSVPLVALTPLLALVFGRGLLAVSILVGLVTFFPTLVNVLMGLKSAPQPACDVVRALGGSAVTVARKARLMYAVPALSASARIALPAAVTGATLAEWLATGKGIGNLLLRAGEGGDYLTLWSAGVLVVILVLVLYALLGVIDRLLTRRFGLQGS